MKIFKPKFWNVKNSLLSLMLLPISYLIEIIIFLKKNFQKEIKFNLKIICIGNIYIGGTGKTPLAVLIGKELLKEKKKIAIVRKFYKSHADEHKYLKENFKDLILKKNRVLAVSEAEKMGFDTAILDDGFQDYKIKKDVNIICFNQNQLIGNGFVFPSGPLRENLKSLENVQIVVINGKKNINFEMKILEINKDIQIFYTYYDPVNINEFQNKKLLALAGIGNPENFFKLLQENNLNVVKRLIYPDHYKFSKKEIVKILRDAKENGFEVVMTEKDFYKIKEFNLNDIKYLKVNLIIKQKEKLIKKIVEIND